MSKLNRILVRSITKDLPKAGLARELFWWSVRVPALARTELIVPVLDGEITLIWTGYTFMSAACVILHRDGCWLKVGRGGKNLNAQFVVAVCHTMLHFWRNCARRTGATMELDIKRIIAMIGGIYRYHGLVRFAKKVFQIWEEININHHCHDNHKVQREGLVVRAICNYCYHQLSTSWDTGVWEICGNCLSVQSNSMRHTWKINHFSHSLSTRLICMTPELIN